MTTLSARLQITAQADLTPDAPHSQTIGHALENAPSGRGWRQGTGSGEVDRVYLETNTLSSGTFKLYDLALAGGLEDVLGQTIDADELKGLCIKCTAGQVTLDGHATNSINFFEDKRTTTTASSSRQVRPSASISVLPVST
jgi:hypothetical protein